MLQKITSNEDFEYLVKRLEQQAKSDPKAYQNKVKWLALLGKLYLWFVVIVVVAALVLTLWLTFFVNFLWFKLILVVAPVTWLVMRALTLNVQAPETGVEIEQEDAPALFAIIRELEQQLNAPRFHHVYLSDEFNAAVAQVPKGLFGSTTNYLILGLPLMQALSVEQFKAVLAHEFGHLSRSHGRFSNKIYRQRIRLGKILDAFEDSRRGGDVIIRPFFEWYVPYFHAYSFPLARANEYEADRIAASVTSPKAMAQALTNSDVVDSYRQQRYWSDIFKQAKAQPQPSARPHLQFASYFLQHLDANDTQHWLNDALKRETDIADTHPSLKDRLNALQQTPQPHIVADAERAYHLLLPCLDEVVNYFDEEWQQQIQPSWQQRYQEHQADRQTFVQLQARIKAGEILTMDEQYQRLCLADSLGVITSEAFVEKLTQFVKVYPRHESASFTLGYLLLNNQDETGVKYLQQVIELNPKTMGEAAEIIRDYYWQIGQKTKADEWHERYARFMQNAYDNYIENTTISLNDEFVPHALNAEQYERVKLSVQALSGIRQAYLARQVGNAQVPDRHVIIFKAIGAMETYSRNKVRQVTDELDKFLQKVDVEIITISVDEDTENHFIKRFKKIDGTKLK